MQISLTNKVFTPIFCLGSSIKSPKLVKKKEKQFYNLTKGANIKILYLARIRYSIFFSK